VREKEKTREEKNINSHLGRNAGADADGREARGRAASLSRGRRRGRAANESGGGAVVVGLNEARGRFFLERRFFLPFVSLSKREERDPPLSRSFSLTQETHFDPNQAPEEC